MMNTKVNQCEDVTIVAHYIIFLDHRVFRVF